MKQACRASIKCLEQGKTGDEAIALALSILEDCEHTNAGLGSNLNIAGQVECDALLMSGNDAHFASVAACQGVRNPSLLVHHLFKESRTKTTMSLGRLRPLMLAGKGCWHAAKQRKLLCAANDLEYDQYLVTDAAKAKHKLYMSQVSAAQQELLLDTVGVICMDMYGHLYAGVSSGGIAMKQIGRVGEAAMFGCGCWANDTFACSISGTGESIMLSMLAKSCADLAQDDESDSEAMYQQVFTKLVPSAKDMPSYAGLITYRKEWKELSWCYNTASFAVAYQSQTMKDATGFVSKNSNTNKPFAFGAVKA